MDNITINELLERLRSGQKEFRGIVLTQADFSGLDLRGIVIKNSKLDFCNFENSDLTDADFSGSSLLKCSFVSANLKNAKFIASNLSNANFRNAYFERTVLRNANLIGAHLCKSDLSISDIEGANMTFVCLVGTNISTEQMMSIPKSVSSTMALKETKPHEESLHDYKTGIQGAEQTVYGLESKGSNLAYAGNLKSGSGSEAYSSRRRRSQESSGHEH